MSASRGFLHKPSWQLPQTVENEMPLALNLYLLRTIKRFGIMQHVDATVAQQAVYQMKTIV